MISFFAFSGLDVFFSSFLEIKSLLRKLLNPSSLARELICTSIKLARFNRSLPLAVFQSPLFFEHPPALHPPLNPNMLRQQTDWSTVSF